MAGLIPPGCRAMLIGSATSVADLNAFAPMEEGSVEGSLFLMRLDFAGFPTGEELAELDRKLRKAGVPAWPGYVFIVYADTAQPSVYLAWQKGFAWLPVILGILALTVLPPLLGSILWLILPESLKELINSLIGMGMMMLVLFIMTPLMKSLTAPEKTKKIEEAKA